jgi:hypothetical protein
METMLKAIDTFYKGHRFRSRLEARWAVFFDRQGIKYNYELEGYAFDDYRYLPDFWIPSWEVYLEIKPKMPTDEEMKRYVAFAQHALKSLLVLYGEPSELDHRIAWCSPVGLEARDLRFAWCREDHCEQVFIANETCAFAQGLAPFTDHDCWKYAFDYNQWPLVDSIAREAFNAATSARFEFGEGRS